MLFCRYVALLTLSHNELIDDGDQINMLISVRLLQRASAESKVLDGVKLRCQLDRETAERVALSVGLKNWRDYLDEYE